MFSLFSLTSMTNLIQCLLGFVALIAPANKYTTVIACNAISRLSIETLQYTDACNADYQAAQNHYWSSVNTDNVPQCVVFPASTNDVVKIMRVLGPFTDVNFAVKSGGHNPNKGWSSVDSGVLISLSKMATTTLSKDKKTADLLPGARWQDVVSTLDPFGVTVVGGRVGDVGVGGLLLGCGLSYLSGQYGLPCDNILNYEVVLANAAVVDANATSNPDLFWALKGGGNEFGIVTKFTVRTYPIGQIWGGVRTYTADKAQAILNATAYFTENNDPKAGIIVTTQIIISNLSQFFAIFYFYNGPTPPTGGIFSKFDAISSFNSTTKTSLYSDLLVENNQLASIYGFRYLLRGATIPNLPGTLGTDLVNANYNSYTATARGMGLSNLLEPGFAFILIYQPVPYNIPAASVAVNPAGNLLGLSANGGDQMWMSSSVSWLTSLGDQVAYTTAAKILNDIKEYTQTKYAGIPSSNYKSGSLAQQYHPEVFMNDGMFDQKVLQGYGNQTYSRLQLVRQAYDPNSVYAKRTMGFR